MKKSKYNFKVDLEGRSEYILYNSKTNALAVLEGDEISAYEEEKFEGLGTKMKNNFLQGGFLVEDDIDELEEIRFRLNRSRYSTSSLSLTIALTADCNFRCAYCYEKENLKDSYMTKKHRENIVRFVEDAAKNGLGSLNITWYGGEPLLAFSDLKYLAENFLRLKEQYKFNYFSFMVSNGFLLNRKIVEELNRLQVSGYQITIDGDEKSHNKKRFLKGGGATYRTILDNLKNSIDILPNISLRINVDKQNIDKINGLISELESINKDDKISTYLGKVENYKSLYADSLCLSDVEFSKKEFEFFKGTYPSAILEKYPNLRGNFCGADGLSSYVMASDGKVFKCWSDIGYEKTAIGHLTEDGISLNNRSYYLDLMNFDPTSDKECSACVYLPICMGGCPYDRINKKQKTCLKNNYYFDGYIKEITSILLGNSSNEEMKNL
ncbi:SPASM domain-containing protein [Peptoniphilus sp. GNH]|nr:SPASM domain-containing protein [Peptoniphilus sp. GNH]